MKIGDGIFKIKRVFDPELEGAAVIYYADDASIEGGVFLVKKVHDDHLVLMNSDHDDYIVNMSAIEPDVPREYGAPTLYLRILE